MTCTCPAETGTGLPSGPRFGARRTRNTRVAPRESEATIGLRPHTLKESLCHATLRTTIKTFQCGANCWIREGTHLSE